MDSANAKTKAKAKAKVQFRRARTTFLSALLFPYRWVMRRATTKILVLFVATFVTSGIFVFLFEHEKGNKDQFVSIWDGVWWGIVTITTTGYGDKFPGTPGGRVVAALTMCVGIVAAGLVTGNIASWLVDQKLREGRGILNLAGKMGHLVICGWKRDMTTFIEEIMLLDGNLRLEDIVIIAPIPQETLEAFRAEERFVGISIVRGDYFSQTMLEHGSVKFAKKVIVLSDWSSASQSLTSIDSKTVMTAMTVRKMAPEVYIAAEITDPRFDNYLHLAQCDEIMHSKEFSRLLLAGCTRRRGMAHVVYDLLNVRTDTSLITVAAPADLIGKPYGEIRKHYREKANAIAIGLLENTGNLHRMKKEALAEAQKNPDTRTVLRNIKSIRGLRPNQPIINPSREYVVKKNTMVVLVGDRRRVS